MKFFSKILVLTLVFLGGFYLISSFYISHQLRSHGGLLDDKDRPVPFFRVMSDVDDTAFKPILKNYYKEIMTDSLEYKKLNSDDYTARINEICTYYDDICDRMKYEHAFSQREKYVFTTFLTFLITEVDAHILLESVSGLRSTLASITYKKDSSNTTRGMAGHRNVIINTHAMKSSVELFEVLTHELMHVFDLGVLDDKFSQEKDMTFLEYGDPSFGVNDPSLPFYRISWEQERTKKKETMNNDIISGYGHTNTFEDFAEFGNAWINHHVPALVMAMNDPEVAQKYMFFKKIFGKRFINLDIETYKKKSLKENPYDTTRRWETVADKI